MLQNNARVPLVRHLARCTVMHLWHMADLHIIMAALWNRAGHYIFAL